MERKSIRPTHHIIDLRIPQGDSTIPRDWKRQFLSEPENSWLCEVPNEFILDKFNLNGLSEKNNLFQFGCDIITTNFKLDGIPSTIIREIKLYLPQLYGQIHARYIISPDGLKQMQDLYRRAQFGTCPRVSCANEHLIPIGRSSKPSEDTVKAFCPRCRRLYNPKSGISLDGSFFGPNMVHILMDELGLSSHHKSFCPFVRTAFGFRVADKRLLDPSDYR